MFGNITRSLARSSKTLRHQPVVSFSNNSEYSTNFKYLTNDRTVSIVGIPFCEGQPLGGVEKAPEEFRASNMISRIEKLDWKVNDCGDVQCTYPELGTFPKEGGVRTAPGPLLNCPALVSKVNEESAKVTYERAKAGDFVLSIGGDHSIAIGTIAGLLKARPDMGIIWVDAHADINTPITTQSGNIHGMCLSFLMKHPDSKDVPEYQWLNDYPTFDPKRIVYIGLRDLDVGEKRIIRDMGIKAFSMHEVDKFGIGNVMEKAVEHLRGRKDCPIHLSFDIDGVDPVFAPSTGTRVAGGLTNREAYYICEAVSSTGLLASMDIVEVNSALSDQTGANNTQNLATGLVVASLGDSII